MVVEKEKFLECVNYQQGVCKSCSMITLSYAKQIQSKQDVLLNKLSPFITKHANILAPARSDLMGFRYKAKMVVSGEVQNVTLGLQDEQGKGIDLTNCALYTQEIRSTFDVLKQFILKVGLTPYNISKKKGRLKYILISQTFIANELMIRFVLNDETKIEAMKIHLNDLFEALPALKVVSVNIQPIHQAVLEGDKEIILSDEQALREVFNEIPLFIKPKSFFQTHPKLAEKLYNEVAQMSLAIKPKVFWDLFCGVGGFGLTILKTLSKANWSSQLTGIEIEPNAIQSARQSAKELELLTLSFEALDSTLFAADNIENEAPGLLIVNPPRRGLGKQLSHYINDSKIPHLIYSSCNINTLAVDLATLTNYTIQSIQMYDFFPHTEHFEVLVRLIHE